jgi:hypothetical protein
MRHAELVDMTILRALDIHPGNRNVYGETLGPMVTTLNV